MHCAPGSWPFALALLRKARHVQSMFQNRMHIPLNVPVLVASIVIRSARNKRALGKIPSEIISAAAQHHMEPAAQQPAPAVNHPCLRLSSFSSLILLVSPVSLSSPPATLSLSRPSVSISFHLSLQPLPPPGRGELSLNHPLTHLTHSPSLSPSLLSFHLLFNCHSGHTAPTAGSR